MRDLPFVDAHFHLWDFHHLHYPWLTAPFNDEGLNGSTEAIAKTYLLDDYLADAKNWNVAGAVHVEAAALQEEALAESHWLEKIVVERGMPNAIVAFAALNDPRVETLLDAQAALAHVRGIRHIVNWHENPRYTVTERDLLADPAWERGYAALGRYGLSFDLQVFPQQLAAAAEIAHRHPDVPLILNHCGMPLYMHEQGAMDQWRRNMRLLAGVPHAAVKISGFGIIDHGWTTERIRPYVLETIEMFGIERCMFASDFPADKLYTDFDTVLDAFDNIVADFNDEERRALFGRNAVRIYHLALDI